VIILVSLPGNFVKASTNINVSGKSADGLWYNSNTGLIDNTGDLSQQTFIGSLGLAVNVTTVNSININGEQYYVYNLVIGGFGDTQWNPDQYPGTTGNFVLGATVRPDWNYNNINGIFLNISGIGRLPFGYNVTKSPNPPPQIPFFETESGAEAVGAAVHVISYYYGLGSVGGALAGGEAWFFAEEAFYAYNAWAASFDYGYNFQSTADSNSCANVWLTLLTTGAKNSYGIYQYFAVTDIQVGIPANYINDGLVYTVTPYVSIYYSSGWGSIVYKYENITFTSSGIELSDGGLGINSYGGSSSGGSGGGGSCVYGMEPILMADGTYELAENIKVGDQVMTYNFTTNSEQSGNITKIELTNESEMYIINGILYLAPDQYVWTERGWIMAENITYNDTIYNVFTGYYDPVSSIIAVNGTIQMYDFTVNINGNYISFAYILKDLGGIHVC